MHFSSFPIVFNHISLSSLFTCHFLHLTDFLKELLESRKKRAGALKAGKGKAKINDFDISDDDGKHSRPKRVSFLKTQRISPPSEDTTASESRENEPPDASIGRYNDYNTSFSSRHSTNVSEDNTYFKSSDGESNDPQITRESTSQSLSFQTSEDTLLDMPLPLPSENSMTETPGPEGKSNSALEESSQTPQLSAADLKHMSSAGLFTLFLMYSTCTHHILLSHCYYSDSATEREPPRPKPRQRTLGLSLHAAEKIAEDAESQDLSRPHTSSVSIPLSTDSSSNIAVRSNTSHMCLIAWVMGISKCKSIHSGLMFVFVVSPCSGQTEIIQIHAASANPLQTRVNSRRSSPSLRLILDPEVITGIITLFYFCIFIIITHYTYCLFYCFRWLYF